MTVKGLVSDTDVVAEFTVEWDAGIDAILVFSTPAPDADAVTSARYINKPLLLRGLVTLGRFENPIGAQLAEIECLPDDPDREQWETGHPMFRPDPETIRRITEALQPFYEAQATINQMSEATRWLHANQEVIRQMSEATRPFRDTPETVRKMTEAMQPFRGAQETVRKMTEAMQPFRGAQETVRKMTEAMQPFRDAQEAIRKMTETTRWLRASQNTGREVDEEPESPEDGPDQNHTDE